MIQSNLVTVDLTLSSGVHLPISSLSDPIRFVIPIPNSHLTNQTITVECQSPIAGNPLLDTTVTQTVPTEDTIQLSCSWWNPSTHAWSADGCVTEGWNE